MVSGRFGDRTSVRSFDWFEAGKDKFSTLLHPFGHFPRSVSELWYSEKLWAGRSPFHGPWGTGLWLAFPLQLFYFKYSRDRNFRPNLFFSPIIDVFFPKINPTISPQPDYWITSGNLKGVSVDSEKVSWTSGPSISFCLLWFMNNKFSRIIFRNPGPN